ncbi:MAG TPA: isocitrate lyase/phosphoenolpyruvate mutase family protein [Acidimicrobiales bacterium]
MTPAPTGLAAAADRLRSMHRPGDPLVLVNAWDAASARLVERAGAAAIATTSAGLVESLGFEDTDTADPDVVFAAVARITAAVQIPVTADLEAGYGLDAGTFVDRLLAAGAVGCNVEDTDHHGGGVLVDAEANANRIAAIKQAGRAAGVDVVVNARTDGFVRRVGDALDESLVRGRLYREAGADCVYPIGMSAEDDIARCVAEIGAPVNVMLRPGAPSPAELAALGVARVSIGSGLYRLFERVGAVAADALLANGDPGPLFARTEG